MISLSERERETVMAARDMRISWLHNETPRFEPAAWDVGWGFAVLSRLLEAGKCMILASNEGDTKWGMNEQGRGWLKKREHTLLLHWKRRAIVFTVGDKKGKSGFLLQGKKGYDVLLSLFSSRLFTLCPGCISLLFKPISEKRKSSCLPPSFFLSLSLHSAFLELCYSYNRSCTVFVCIVWVCSRRRGFLLILALTS